MPFRSYKYELKLNPLQEQTLHLYMDSLRKVYNYYLKYHASHYVKHKSFIAYEQVRKHIPTYLYTHANEFLAPRPLVEQIVDELHRDIDHYLKNPACKPSFKKDHDAFRLIFKTGFRFDQETEKVQVGDLAMKLRYTRPLQGYARSLEVSTKAGRWYATFVNKIPLLQPSQEAITCIGIDVGLKEFAVLSNGRVVSNPRYYRCLESRFRKEQRALSRKTKHSQNWRKQRLKVQKAYADLVHYRSDFLHRLSTEIVEAYDVIGIEKLDILEMTENKKLRKSILDASWGLFLKYLRYKAEERGKFVIEVGRYFPSSQLCSRCGAKQIMPLHLRTYRCRACSFEIDRDFNASKNIEQEAFLLYQKKKGNLTSATKKEHSKNR